MVSLSILEPMLHCARGGLVFLAALLFASSAEAACDGVFAGGFETPTVMSGSATLQTSDGQTHTYYYRVPQAGLSGCRPVLFWLHGDGGSGNGFGSGFYPYTDAASAILVTPSGINQTWTHAAADIPNQPQDSQFISKIIDALINNGIANTPVDATRIYLGGESRGAYMPYFLLQRQSTKSRLAAVAVNAGLLYCQAHDTDCDDSESSPAHHSSSAAILHLHGTNDTQVTPPPTALFHHPIDWDVDWRVFYPMNFWSIQNGCFRGDDPDGKDDGVLIESYSANGHTANVYDLTHWGSQCSKYQLILVDNGGHVIGNQYQRIWSFLSRYRLGD